MGHVPRLHVTLLGRIALFLTAFGTALLLQIGITSYQTSSVIAPMERRTAEIQAISQFLNEVEGCMNTLENYRWDYSDPATLIVALRQHQSVSASHLSEIHADIGQVSEEYYLLANAATTTYGTLTLTLDEIIGNLLTGKTNAASRIYYEKAEPCGGYLRQYTQQLLERAILDNQDHFTAMTALNGRLNQVQVLAIVMCLLLGCAVVVSLFRLLRSVVQMAKASQAISQGQFDTPDVDESQGDEIGHMAKAFNEMKRSMKQQVRLLEEKNEMERALFRKEHEALELQNLMEREKLQQLRSQINPHFLFNTLNVIAYTAQHEGAEKTRQLIVSLSKLFRYALASNEAQVPLAREIRIVDEFYALNRARFGARVNMRWHISPDVDLTETMVPSFILQPLVENAFKHGLAPKEAGGCVDIDIRIQEDILKIRVEDDGVGMTPEALEKLRGNLRNPPTTGEHIGVYNVAARLRLQGEDYGLDIESESGKGTAAVIRFPLVIQREEETADGENSDRG